MERLEQRNTQLVGKESYGESEIRSHTNPRFEMIDHKIQFQEIKFDEQKQVAAMSILEKSSRICCGMNKRIFSRNLHIEEEDIKKYKIKAYQHLYH